MKNLPILYSFVRCPYAMRGRIALVEEGINCILREVNLREKPPQLLAISPKATVPVLLFSNGEILDESIDIVLYASQKSKYLNLEQYGKDKKKIITSLISDNDTEFVRFSRIYKYPDRYPNESAAECKKAIEDIFLSKYEIMLKNSEYLLGEKTIADIAILPFIRQFAKVDEDWFFSSKYINIIRWLESFTERDNFKNIIMVKNKPWKEGDEPIYLM